MRKWVLFICLLTVAIFCNGQVIGERFLKFSPVFGGAPLQLNKVYTLNDDTITISTMRFYVSGVALLKNGAEVLQLKDKYFLLDLEDKLQIPLEANFSLDNVDAVRFNIGVDSSVNVSGAMGGDLDPLHGMYWTWQSGYINFKLEGTSKKCKTRNQAFQFHIGGYAHPHSTLHTITLPIEGNSLEIAVNIDKLLVQLDLSETHTMMSPGAKAVQLANTFKEIFTIRR